MSSNAPAPKQTDTVRIGSLDALRGVAILGILIMNIPTMGGGIESGDYPPMLGWSSADKIIWWLQDVLAEGTMRGLLSLLFGASFILMTGLGDTDAPGTAVRYYRRTGWMIAFGAIHGFVLLWPGDILLIYGLAGLLLYPARRWRPRLLIASGLILLGSMAISVAAAEHAGRLAQPAAAAQAAVASDAAAHRDRMAATERAARLGGVSDNLRFQFRTSVDWTLTPWTLWWVADALAFMLIGAGLFRLGVLQGTAPARLYGAMLLLGYGIGLPLNLWESWTSYASNFTAPAFTDAPTYEISRLAMTAGHLGALLLAWRTGLGRRLLDLVTPVGRLALSNYIGQTIICQWLLFPGFALGLFGALGWAELMGLLLVIWSVEILLSHLWLRTWRLGPLEWLWRSLTAGSLQPLRR